MTIETVELRLRESRVASCGASRHSRAAEASEYARLPSETQFVSLTLLGPFSCRSLVT